MIIKVCLSRQVSSNCISLVMKKLILSKCPFFPGQKALIPKSLHQELKEAKESLSLCLDTKEGE